MLPKRLIPLYSRQRYTRQDMEPNDSLEDPISQVIAYHERTKHHFHRYALGPGHMDWATQPDPFRRYRGDPLLPLDHIAPSESPLYDEAFTDHRIPPVLLNRRSISQLFYDSLALSAWKQAGTARWALRVNPSSGNLHPTEGYLLCGAIPGLSDSPFLAHYAPKEHALEIHAHIPATLWQRLLPGLLGESVLVGLSSIHWREAWKYGERAYRYCHHDAGHALAALSIAAAGLGWKASLLDDLGTEDLRILLGLNESQGPEVEHPDCLIVIGPEISPKIELNRTLLPQFKELEKQGVPNILSPAHRLWEIIDEVARVAEKSSTVSVYGYSTNGLVTCPDDNTLLHPGVKLRPIIHQRRSAVAMDSRTAITRETFYKMLYRTLPDPACAPFHTLPWPPQVHLAIFVHRVKDLAPGLYLLVRDPARLAALKEVIRTDFDWVEAPAVPLGLALFQLAFGDVRTLAQAVSCHQEIAADGCFSLGMIARFEPTLREYGAWFYPRLYWECGAIGQVLYLEAEACGIRSTGMGCYFDNPMQEVLGLEGSDYQSLYHFTVGGALEDPRLQSLPAYPQSESHLPVTR